MSSTPTEMDFICSQPQQTQTLVTADIYQYNQFQDILNRITRLENHIIVTAQEKKSKRQRSVTPPASKPRRVTESAKSTVSKSKPKKSKKDGEHLGGNESSR